MTSGVTLPSGAQAVELKGLCCYISGTAYLIDQTNKEPNNLLAHICRIILLLSNTHGLLSKSIEGG
jgi:hypothetical protein